MSRPSEPKKQYTDDGERENAEQMPDIGSDPTELPQEPPIDRPDPDDEDKAVPEGTGGERTEGGAGMVQTE